VKVSSVRKSFLSALYGPHVRAGRLDLMTTLAELGIDDEPPLTAAEKTATLRMVLQARSGVYHPYVGGLLADREAMPARGSHPPGSFWYYNNWDFNVLGTVFEQQLRVKIGTEFRDRIATPIQMEGFRLEDMYYFGGTPQTAVVEQSLHPPLSLPNDGKGHGAVRLPVPPRRRVERTAIGSRGLVAESTTAYSDTGGGGGYGYLWWVNGFPGLSQRTYSARGALGKYIVVVPDRDLVVVYQNHSEFPDDAAAYTSDQLAKLPNVSGRTDGGSSEETLGCPASRARVTEVMATSRLTSVCSRRRPVQS
jgi:CubicO group peptidase (beta-lactamase class C family)